MVISELNFDVLVNKQMGCRGKEAARLQWKRTKKLKVGHAGTSTNKQDEDKDSPKKLYRILRRKEPDLPPVVPCYCVSSTSIDTSSYM